MEDRRGGRIGIALDEFVVTAQQRFASLQDVPTPFMTETGIRNNIAMLIRPCSLPFTRQSLREP